MMFKAINLYLTGDELPYLTAGPANAGEIESASAVVTIEGPDLSESFTLSPIGSHPVLGTELKMRGDRSAGEARAKVVQPCFLEAADVLNEARLAVEEPMPELTPPKEVLDAEYELTMFDSERPAKLAVARAKEIEAGIFVGELAEMRAENKVSAEREALVSVLEQRRREHQDRVWADTARMPLMETVLSAGEAFTATLVLTIDGEERTYTAKANVEERFAIFQMSAVDFDFEEVA